MIKSQAEKEMKKGMVIILVLAALLMMRPTFAQPTEPHDANAMWMESSEIDVTGVSVGYKFNVTVWINLTEQCAGWQFYLLYDKSLLNVTRCGLTAGDKSDFFKNITTIPLAPSFGVENATHDWVVNGESWIMGDFRDPGYGSLSWIEFEVMTEPPFTCVLDISTSHHPDDSKTYALTTVETTPIEIELNVYDVYVIPEFSSWLAVILLSLTFFAALITAKKIK